jgi:decarbamoylnovobiocin carbamoyltransferase/7-O-carbamoyltransferase
MFSGEDDDLAPDMGEGFFHDAAACLIRDGELLVAVEEERFNRIKKTTKFPINAIRECLVTAGVTPAQVDAVGHYFEESTVDEALHSIYRENPQLPVRSSRELITDRLKGELDFDLPDDRLLYSPHHVAHAMASFVRSGLDEALVVVMDGRGEDHSTTVFRGAPGRLETLAAHSLGKSFGKFYRQGTKLLGYGFGDEYKVMGLAPYGTPDRYHEYFNAMYALKDQGDFELRWRDGIITSNAFRPRRKGQEFTQEHMDFAASLQQTLERTAMHVLGYWADQTGLPNLCFTGGVAHNSTLNGLILRSGKFREVFVHPASHDGGAAEGAALAVSYRLGAPPFSQPRMRSASVGPGLGTTGEIEEELASWRDLIEYEQPADIIESAAALLAGGAVLGWAHGPSEYGPRALGNRSILADARPSENKERINSMIKKREGYRPFAPVVTAEAAETYFHIPETRANYDFMSFVVDVREDRRAELGAVTHIDGSARVQVIEPASNERFYSLVRRFGELTGTPVLLNTSFNNNAEPIVQTVRDVLTCFLTTELDFLVLDDFLIRRRAGRSLAFGGFIPRFRPVTRLAKRIRITPAGAREVTHEIYLQYPNGPRAELSPSAFRTLEAVDGVRTLESLSAAAGGLNDVIRREIYSLWQRRFFALQPPVTEGLPADPKGS